MAAGPGISRRLIAVSNRAAFNAAGNVEREIESGLLIMFRPWLDAPDVAYKGMRTAQLFARRDVRSNLRQRWESAWQSVQGRARPVPSGWDVDHVFPFCWAQTMGFDYVLLTPVHRSPNRSAGGGVEKTANQDMTMLNQLVETSGPYAYLSTTGVAKLMSVSPGSGQQNYPGLQQIAPDLQQLQSLLAY